MQLFKDIPMEELYIAGGNDEILPEIENTQFIKNHAID
jgi:hypothetical protein